MIREDTSGRFCDACPVTPGPEKGAAAGGTSLPPLILDGDRLTGGAGSGPPTSAAGMPLCETRAGLDRKSWVDAAGWPDDIHPTFRWCLGSKGQGSALDPPGASRPWTGPA